MNEKSLQVGFLLACLAGAIVLSIVLYAPFLSVLAVAAMAAVIMHPMHMRLSKLLRGKETLSAFLTVLTVVALLLGPVTVISLQVFSETADLYADVTANRLTYVRSVERVVLEVVHPLNPGFRLNTESYIQQGLGWITSHLGRLFSGTLEVLFSLFLFLVAFYYLLKDGPRFMKAVMALSPLSDRYDQAVFDRMSLAVNSMVRGQLFVATLQGFLTGIGFAIFGVPSPALWGAVAALCALIPGFGTSLVIIPGIIVLFATGHLWQAFGLIVWGALAVGLIDNLLGPTLIGRGAKIHPLFVLFAVLGGLLFYGPMGFLLGPLTISLLFALLDIYRMLILKSRPMLTEK